MKVISIFTIAFSLMIFTGCVSTSIFPINHSQTLKSEAEFRLLIHQPEKYQGQAVKLAGRMVEAKTLDEGTIVTAEWLPFPDAEYLGPTDLTMDSESQFVLFYPKKLDPEGITYGNKFLVIGVRRENQSETPLGMTSGILPYIMAHCLHIWKTGVSEIDTQGYSEYSYPAEETYCSG